MGNLVCNRSFSFCVHTCIALHCISEPGLNRFVLNPFGFILQASVEFRVYKMWILIPMFKHGFAHNVFNEK